MCAIPPPNQLCLTKLPPQRGFYTAWKAGTHNHRVWFGEDTHGYNQPAHFRDHAVWVPALRFAWPGRQLYLQSFG